ncbi:MAG: LapA family protein [Desulfovibrio sp.]|nr:LapA family protein [Desulfovibrio sp.]
MRYIKVLLLAVLFFLALIFFFQNQAALSQKMALTLHLFFLPAMTSIELPFYFLVISAFFIGVLLAVSFLAWEKFTTSAKLMKTKWRVSSLEREVEKLRKQVESVPQATRKFFHRSKPQEAAPASAVQDKSAQPETKAASVDDIVAPDPDKA